MSGSNQPAKAIVLGRIRAEIMQCQQVRSSG